jgi:hypothetical protein
MRAEAASSAVTGAQCALESETAHGHGVDAIETPNGPRSGCRMKRLVDLRKNRRRQVTRDAWARLTC